MDDFWDKIADCLQYSRDLPTIGIVGGVFVVNREWWKTLSPEWKREVLIHEMKHLIHAVRTRQ